MVGEELEEVRKKEHRVCVQDSRELREEHLKWVQKGTLMHYNFGQYGHNLVTMSIKLLSSPPSSRLYLSLSVQTTPNPKLQYLVLGHFVSRFSCRTTTQQMSTRTMPKHRQQ